MSAGRTVPRLETLAYAVRSLWGSHVICGGVSTRPTVDWSRDIGVGRSHDISSQIVMHYANMQGIHRKTIGGRSDMYLERVFIT